jgi:subtilisin family serine protease
MRSIRVMASAVVAVVLTGAVVSTAAASDPLRGEQWYLDAIGAPGAHEVSTGSGALVAVLDTGVDTGHPDLAGAIRVGPDLVGDNAGEDLNGHGTNVAGIIVGVAGNGIGIEGAAPAAKALSVRVLGADKQGNSELLAKGIDAAVAAGAQVINLSLNPGVALARTLDTTDPMVGAMQRAIDAGVVVVAAAGNEALPLCVQPLAVTGLLCVGAVDRKLELAPYSNYAVRVDVVAPGGDDVDGIASTAPGGVYATMRGTSQATPQVAALAALLVARGLRGQQVVDRVKQTARDLGAPGQDLQFGSGLIDMNAAVDGLGPRVPAAAPAASGQAPTARASSIAALSATAPKRIDRRRLLKTGVIVGCRAARAGVCRVEIRTGRRLLARGARRVRAGTTANVRVRVTKAGRSRVTARRRLGVTIRVQGPGGTRAVMSSVIER